jgi:hypothetical protein
MIEPVFEELVRAKARRQVDLAVGMGSMGVR